MDLVDHWVIGFSGKRQLKNPEGVRAALRDVFQELRRAVKGETVAMSSAAIGADLLFATEATGIGMPWICVLPFPEAAFFNERDFPDEAERSNARQKVREAADCEVTRIPRDVNELSDPTWRRAAFAEAGFRCVDEADIVIMVLHDGAAGKPGGTGDVLTYARAGKRPLITIDPETLHVQWENWPARLHDQLTEQLRRLPTGKLSDKDQKKLPTSAAVKVAEWRSGFGRAARRHVPGIRWLTTFVVVFHAAATIITAGVFLLDWNPKLWEPIAFVLVLIGFGFLLYLLLQKPQVKGANYRLAAEIGRSVLAVWSIPEAGTEILRGLPRNFVHLARNLLLQQRLDPDRRRDFRRISPDEIEKLATGYVTLRISSQIGYYRDKRERAGRWARIFEWISIVLSLTAVICAGVLAFRETPPLERLFSEIARSEHPWGFAKLLAATAAPVVVSLLVIHEIKRREARYEEMEGSLQQFAERIGRVRSLTALRDAVVDTEHMLLSECYDWWVLAKANVAA